MDFVLTILQFCCLIFFISAQSNNENNWNKNSGSIGFGFGFNNNNNNINDSDESEDFNYNQPQRIAEGPELCREGGARHTNNRCVHMVGSLR